MAENRARIRVVNTNSNEAVTSGIDAALEPLRFADGPEIGCATLAEGPRGIETQADVANRNVRDRRAEGEAKRSRCAGWSRQTIVPTRSSSPVTAIRGCICAAKAPAGRCSASPNAGC